MKNRICISIILPVMLTVITILLMFLPMGSGMLFGSEGDWYMQHVVIADGLRHTMLDTGSVIPQYMRLGGGSSIYDFAYYGLLRPDILFSCLIPDVEMKYIIAGYAVLGVIASVNLCYIWLKKQEIDQWFAFTGAVILATAACFYHAHHQIMFVNYMPFLFLALMGVDRFLEKRRSGLLVLSLFFIYTHSFYYSITCLVVVGIYALYKLSQRKELWQTDTEHENEKGIFHNRKTKWKYTGKTLVKEVGKLILPVALSIGMAMVLLLPTGLDILSTKKDGGKFAEMSLKAVDWSLEGLLYNPYGCGMTLITLYCLILSLTSRRKRFLSAAVLSCLLFPAAAFVLNGFLYSRAKILIPFSALLVLLVADTLQELYRKKQKYFLLPLLLCFIPVFSWGMDSGRIIPVDGILLLLWAVFQRTCSMPEKVRKAAFALILIVPVYVSLTTNGNEAYLSLKDKQKEHFTSEEISDFVADSRYRFDIFSNSFVNTNKLANGDINRTAIYSSVTNKEYAEFYYDTMHNPISLNNRVALSSAYNSLFTYVMGVKYLQVNAKNLPEGYTVKAKKGNDVLAECEDVLPICYGTTRLMGEEEYESLEFPDTLEALCSRAVVPDKTGNEMAAAIQNETGYQKDTFVSHIKSENIEDFFKDDDVKKLLNPSGKSEKKTLQLKKPLEDRLLIISFHVDSKNGGAAKISINGMRNVLSSLDSAYPNNNHDFVYVLNAEKIKKLKVKFSKGSYTIDNLKIYTVDRDVMKHPDVVIPEISKKMIKQGKGVFNGSINMEQAGYFITSYPYRQGYEIMVDGKPVEAEKVNTTFVGFPVSEGEHTIDICFEAPGYRFGFMVSIACFILFAGLLLFQLRKKDH